MGVYGPRRYMYIRLFTDYVKYDMRKHHYILRDLRNGEKPDDESAAEVNGPALIINAMGGQQVKVSVDVVWRYNMGKLQTIHQEIRNDPLKAEEKILDNPVRRIAQTLVTTKTAFDVYYGEKLAALQTEFLKAMFEDQAISDAGIVIDTVAIYTDLRPEYVEQINLKATAEQKKLAQEQIQKANQAEADAVKIAAEIEKNKVVVAAQAQNEKTILEAQAAAKQEALKGEGERDRKVAAAEGVKADLLAQAAGEEALKLAKYDGVAGQRRMNVEYATATAEKLRGMLDGKVVLPEKALVQIGDLAVKPVVNMDEPAAPAAQK